MTAISHIAINYIILHEISFGCLISDIPVYLLRSLDILHKRSSVRAAVLDKNYKYNTYQDHFLMWLREFTHSIWFCFLFYFTAYFYMILLHNVVDWFFHETSFFLFPITRVQFFGIRFLYAQSVVVKIFEGIILWAIVGYYYIQMG
jgi:membrane-bound metal-dependent hydrolase YbcI (DUF457 family)